MEMGEVSTARLNPYRDIILGNLIGSGKGGWDSGEIENLLLARLLSVLYNVERVDGTQARLKLLLGIFFEIINRFVERVDGTQARLKHNKTFSKMIKH